MQIGKVSIVLATLFWGIAILATHRPSAEQYISNASWVQDSPNVLNKILQFHQQYLSKHPDSEIARIKLAKYYLDYVDDLDKALEITAPMKDVQKYRLGCSIAAEALYRAGEIDNTKYLEVNDILEKVKEYYENYPTFNLMKLEALMQIQGFVTTAEPAEGVLKLYLLSKIYDAVDTNSYIFEYFNNSKLYEADEADIYYALGYWTSHDVYMGYNRGIPLEKTIKIKHVPLDFAKSAYYLRKAAYMHYPKAAIELGTLYCDVNVIDSAKFYYDMAISQAGGKLKNEALFKMGLLLEQEGYKNNNYLREAINNDYSPAILHQAINQKDHITAIAYYKKIGKYKGFRYIPPIVFEYLQAEEQKGYEGLRDSALALLQQEHPECHFNKEFIEGMEYIIGTPRVNKDLNKATELMQKSGNKGCLYAKMMLFYNYLDYICRTNKNGHLLYLDSLYAISKVIPFAQLLACDINMTRGNFTSAMLDAQRSIANGNPAAGLVLSRCPTDSLIDYWVRGSFIDRFNQEERDVAKFYFAQKTLRLSKIKDKWARDCFLLNKSVRNDFINEVSSYWHDTIESFHFWSDVLIASHNFGAKLEVIPFFVLKEDTFTVEKLALSALADLNDNSRQELWNFWKIRAFGFLRQTEQLRLLDDKKVGPIINSFDLVSLAEQEEFEKVLLDDFSKNLYLKYDFKTGAFDLLDEYSSLVSKSKPYAQREY